MVKILRGKLSPAITLFSLVLHMLEMVQVDDWPGFPFKETMGGPYLLSFSIADIPPNSCVFTPSASLWFRGGGVQWVIV